MSDRLAIKRLTASDCTLFEAVFRRIGAGNQKSINLNADVLVTELYPSLSNAVRNSENEIPLTVSIYGPSGKEAHRISRKIVKNATYKNWRLNGEFILGPANDPHRYDEIEPGDLAIMAFHGEPIPTGMDLIIISQDDQKENDLYRSLNSLFGNRSMITVTALQVGDAARDAKIREEHPIYVVAADPEMEAALEDAAQGGLEGTNRILRNRGRRMSSSDLAKAKSKGELTGHDGEGLVNAYLDFKVKAGLFTNYVWASAENAISPYDFEATMPNGHRILIDAKATNGPFTNVFHLSIAEIIEASGSAPYYIYRVFELDENGGKLCISEDITPLAQQLKSIHETHMPQGVKVDGFSLITATLKWGASEVLVRPEEEGT